MQHHMTGTYSNHIYNSLNNDQHSDSSTQICGDCDNRLLIVTMDSGERAIVNVLPAEYLISEEDRELILQWYNEKQTLSHGVEYIQLSSGRFVFWSYRIDRGVVFTGYIIDTVSRKNR